MFTERVYRKLTNSEGFDPVKKLKRVSHLVGTKWLVPRDDLLQWRPGASPESGITMVLMRI